MSINTTSLAAVWPGVRFKPLKNYQLIVVNVLLVQAKGGEDAEEFDDADGLDREQIVKSDNPHRLPPAVSAAGVLSSSLLFLFPPWQNLGQSSKTHHSHCSMQST